MISTLRYTAITSKIADNIFETALENRSASPQSEKPLVNALIECLRTDNAGIRTRINDTLLYLAKDKGLSVPDDLKNWKPNQKDTINDLDTQVERWKRVDWVPNNQK